MDEESYLLEPPRKKLKTDHQPFSIHAVCLLHNIPRDILSDILDYLEIDSIYSLTNTCHYFKERDLWSLVTRLDGGLPPGMARGIVNLDVNKVTKLDYFDVEHARERSYLTSLLRLTNLLSLTTEGGYYYKSARTNLLSNFPLLRELTARVNPAVLSNYQGVFLTALVFRTEDFDVRCITQFDKLQVLELPCIETFTHADSMTHLTSLTSLTFRVSKMSDADFEELCRHTQLKYMSFNIYESDTCTNSITNLHNLTALISEDYPLPYDKKLVTMTALQHIHIARLELDSFPLQWSSTLTYLAAYIAPDPSPVFRLSALQHLNINAPTSADAYIKLSELSRLTKLSLLFFKSFDKPNMNCAYWTILTRLSCLKLAGNAVDDNIIEVTRQRMPSSIIISK